MKFRHYTSLPKTIKSSYYPTDIASLYNFPQGDGAGQTIGIIELGGGYELADLQTYGKLLNLPPLNITDVSINGAVNVPGGDPAGADGEVNLDIQIIYAIAPKVALRVYFADNSDQGFNAAIRQAIADKCNIISISWGGPEDQWNTEVTQEFEFLFQSAAKSGITVLVAAGDAGAMDDSSVSTPTVDYPASSPNVTACGGTRIYSTGETVWNDLLSGNGASGGGMSSIYPRPAYQTRDHISQVNRCVPDVSANASPFSGYNVIVDGRRVVVGGTSCVSPLLAGLVARVNQRLGRNVGFLNPLLYAMNPRSFYDVIYGNNGYWVSNQNYDLSSGLGRIDGTNILSDISWALDHA